MLDKALGPHLSMLDDIDNYYLFLDLDPSVTNWEPVRHRLDAKQRAWSEARLVPEATACGVGDDLFAQIREALRDDETRLTHAREAQRIREKRRRVELEDLRRAIELRARGEYYTREDVAVLDAVFDAISEERIERAVRELGYALVEKPERDSVETLESTLAERVRRATERADEAHLYACLGRSPDCETVELRDRARRLGEGDLSEEKGFDYAADLREELTELAAKIFESEASRRRYDRTLELWRMEALDRLIAASVRDGVLEHRATALLLDHAERHGVSRKMARRYLEQCADEQGWRLPGLHHPASRDAVADFGLEEPTPRQRDEAPGLEVEGDTQPGIGEPSGVALDGETDAGFERASPSEMETEAESERPSPSDPEIGEKRDEDTPDRTPEEPSDADPRREPVLELEDAVDAPLDDEQNAEPPDLADKQQDDSDSAPSLGDALDPLPRPVAWDIREKLERLDEESLYTFLELPPTSSPRALRDRAREIRDRAALEASETRDAERRAELASRALDVFENWERKERYNHTLGLRYAEGLEADVEWDDRRGTRVLHGVDEHLREARELGLDAELAETCIRAHAEERNWTIPEDARVASADHSQCGFCGTVVREEHATECTHCGEELLLECFRCGAPVPSSYERCTECDAHTGDAARVYELVEEARRALAEGRVEETIEALESVLRYWSGWAKAERALQRARTERKARTRRRRDIELLVENGKLIAAESKLNAFEQRYGDETETESLRSRLHEAFEQTFRQQLNRVDTPKRVWQYYGRKLSGETDLALKWRLGRSYLEHISRARGDELLLQWFLDDELVEAIPRDTWPELLERADRAVPVEPGASLSEEDLEALRQRARACDSDEPLRRTELRALAERALRSARRDEGATHESGDEPQLVLADVETDRLAERTRALDADERRSYLPLLAEQLIESTRRAEGESIGHDDTFAIFEVADPPLFEGYVEVVSPRRSGSLELMASAVGYWLHHHRRPEQTYARGVLDALEMELDTLDPEKIEALNTLIERNASTIARNQWEQMYESLDRSEGSILSEITDLLGD